MSGAYFAWGLIIGLSLAMFFGALCLDTRPTPTESKTTDANAAADGVKTIDR